MSKALSLHEPGPGPSWLTSALNHWNSQTAQKQWGLGSERKSSRSCTNGTGSAVQSSLCVDSAGFSCVLKVDGSKSFKVQKAKLQGKSFLFGIPEALCWGSRRTRIECVSELVSVRVLWVCACMCVSIKIEAWAEKNINSCVLCVRS